MAKKKPTVRKRRDTKRIKPKGQKKNTPKRSETKAKPSEVNFDYIKSNQFRVIRVDGAHGGVTPNGQTIQIAFYSERLPIPQRETYELKNKKLGKRKVVTGRDAIIREVEVESLMDLATAKKIRDWLTKKVESAEQIQKELT